jgi:hypothetical protein
MTLSVGLNLSPSPSFAFITRPISPPVVELGETTTRLLVELVETERR